MQLLERDTHLTELRELAARASQGGGRIALVSGEAGIGKTALVDAFATQLAAAHGHPLVRGACDDLFTPRPLGPLRDIVTEGNGALAHLARWTDDRDAFFGGLLDTLRTLPLVMVIEDVHWADEATLDVLCFTGRRIQSTRALLLLTFRDDELGATHPLRRTLADFPRAATHRMPLPSLSERAVQTLARHAGRSDVGLYAATSGNPFYVTEALAAGRDVVPHSVRDAVLARAARLSGDARKVLDLVSIVPGRTDNWLLEAVLGEVAAAVDECVSAGVLQPGCGTASFRHELARRAWEDTLSASSARLLHERVLAKLLEHGGDASARIVHHAERAGAAETVLQHAPNAAAAAARVGAHLQAAELYGAVMPHSSRLPAAERATLLEAYSIELQIVGRIDDALRIQGEVLGIWRELGDRLREGDTLRLLSRATWYGGDLSRSMELIACAIEVLEPLGATAELAMTYSSRSQSHMLIEEHGPAIDWGRRAIQLGRQLGRTDVVIHSLNNVGTSLLFHGDEEGMYMLEESMRLALELGRHEDAARAMINIAEILTLRREFERAEPYAQQGLRFSTEHDLDSYMLCLLGDRSQVQLALTDWRKATDDAQTVLAHPRVPIVDKIPAYATLGRIRARRGDPDVWPPLDEGLRTARPTGEVARLWPVTAARLECAWLRDGSGSAQSISEIELGRHVIAMAKRVDNRWALGELAFWTHMLGADVPSPETAAEPYRQAMQGDFLGAARGFQVIGMNYDRAIMLALSGQEAAMRDAFEILAALGARATIDRLMRELRNRGVARVPRGPASATRRNPARLTQKQVAVLQLIAQGLSNQEIGHRLFISTKTAAHHVSAVLAKLDSRSRAEAASRARELGLLQPK